MREPWPNGRAHGFVLIVARVVGKCLSKLVGVSHGLMGELMVLNRFFVFLVGGYFESVWWRQCVSVVLVIIGFSGLLACIKLHVRPGHRAYEFVLVMSDC